MNLQDKAVEVAVSQLGQKEDPIGSNKGPMVDEYLKSVGLAPGFAWCQAFVFWSFEQAAMGLTAAGLPTANPVVKTAGVMDCWNRTKSSRKIMAVEAKQRPQLVQPGMQVVFKHSNTAGHTGIVTNVVGNEIHTLEGNTNHDGSREGYEVERKVRLVSDPHLVGFINYG